MRNTMNTYEQTHPNTQAPPSVTTGHHHRHPSRLSDHHPTHWEIT
ncbi:chloroplastic group IIA intron splicing facilitator CRS1, chloroplastic-like protein [Corchorus olitorius]|uniref:Chloroplastic group IIA intron splicing facilitator CRS1, chloroplastic-like protein n=1 Tax=Corchorus olitorius TaxID=93759 RepID=A0A1R3G179_9ROSI|nr:chloroplastic group IIA intron splicing facilitator CRS1, chloroplastic-like protein [Corchorus olitorius]